MYLGYPFSHSYAKWLWDRGYRLFIPQYSPDERILSGRFRLVKEGEAKSRSPKGRSMLIVNKNDPPIRSIQPFVC